MTEEIIIDGGRMAGITTLKNEITRLEQENKELKDKITSLESEIRQKKMTIMMNNDHYFTVDKNNRNYRSALEEIKEIVSDEIDKTDSDDELMKIYGAIYNKINEVLNHSEG